MSLLTYFTLGLYFINSTFIFIREIDTYLNLLQRHIETMIIVYY